ncbi:hypothetical protein GUITHDRAFT_101368 [Guillardia theta CCMP2712]|uniref:Uncharacterized protein n=1 Tax=Guillardia theta (strain CCMP2712) TaxID=905079 RepID=L1JXV1_GUITC|nr:hypothetical protein GUITHDRAFT_101368 [Guillardia theta CCMP2712]EKX52918.1 hypothetical protein GUITHDRAFT_101368 [Guillardia theta CCMP2712]|eukprot:XP_005839898.1 hypothetical protein GUITHDRAFT_101368 [Guillardia theta CCMP2712]
MAPAWCYLEMPDRCVMISTDKFTFSNIMVPPNLKASLDSVQFEIIRTGSSPAPRAKIESLSKRTTVIVSSDGTENSLPWFCLCDLRNGDEIVVNHGEEEEVRLMFRVHASVCALTDGGKKETPSKTLVQCTPPMEGVKRRRLALGDDPPNLGSLVGRVCGGSWAGEEERAGGQAAGSVEALLRENEALRKALEENAMRMMQIEQGMKGVCQGLAHAVSDAARLVRSIRKEEEAGCDEDEMREQLIREVRKKFRPLYKTLVDFKGMIGLSDNDSEEDSGGRM